MLAFSNVKKFAVEHFNAWEHGEDFDWLKKEWHKFEPLISEQKDAEDFILTLAYIYSAFCHESYFLKSKEGIMTIQEYVREFEEEHPVFIERINRKFDFTLELLLRAYNRPSEILREFVSIAINFELPHPDGYDFVKNLFQEKYKERDINSIIS
ncbi:hypothetical protein D1614_09515 [Maribellus luteus]|uniref:Uncharacterized protein n=1 Tax=Maribellus luteus TaxID=2305463 RepID=A0A399SZ30_9BACT|nr:hypothetical protein [Maribellus luteus]RIJ48758.1 hypothetical protein D1614_09515 [Maribellus luteus]